jgi:hypothetical protein
MRVTGEIAHHLLASRERHPVRAVGPLAFQPATKRAEAASACSTERPSWPRWFLRL